MPQKIKHRRGSLESLNSFKGNIEKGEIVIATGSTNLTTTNGTSVTFVATSDGNLEATNRFLMGSTPPATFTNATYDGLVKGVPYYSSDSASIYLLGQDGNTQINLVGNIVPFSQSVSITLGSLQTQINNLDPGGVSAALGRIQESTGSLNVFTQSAFVRFGIIENSTSSLNTFSQSAENRFTSIGYSTASLNTFSQSAENRFTNISYSTASLNLVTRSLQESTASLNLFTQSAENRFREVGNSTSSLNTFTQSAENRFREVGNSTSSLNTFTQSAENRFTNISYSTASINLATGSIQRSTASLNTFTQSAENRFIEIANSTSSINLATGSIQRSTASLNLVTQSLYLFTQSAENRFAGVGNSTASINLSTRSIQESTASLNTYTSSNETRWTNLSSVSGAYAITGSNIFRGNQTISGSLYITQDLVIQGSSSIQNISSSIVNVGTNLFTVNVNQPAVRFGGFAVIDSGSGGGSGSFLYDAEQDEFIFVHRGDGTNLTSSHFVLGPETYNSLGNETYLTNNRLPKGTGKEHLNDSQISDDGTTVSIPGSLTVTNNITGIIRSTNGVISGSSQVKFNELSNISSNIVSQSNSTAQVDLIITNGVISANLRGQVLSGSLGNGILSSSATDFATFTQSLYYFTASHNAWTQSADNRFTNIGYSTASLNLATRSLQESTASLNIFTQSAENRFREIGNSTASINLVTRSLQESTASLNLFTQSAENRFREIGNSTSSLNLATRSLQESTASINLATRSLQESTASINLATGSIQRSTASLNLVTQSLYLFSQSVENRFIEVANSTASINLATGSIQRSTASLNLATRSLQESTASLNLATQSIYLATASLNLATRSLQESTASLNAATQSLYYFSASQNAWTQSADARFTAVGYSTSSLNLATRSLQESTASLNLFTQSFYTAFSLNGANATALGNLTITNNLVVQGDTVTFNTSQLLVEDKMITVASGALTPADANGAGISVAGADASMSYESTRDAWTFNKPLSSSAGFTGSFNLPAGGSSKRIVFRETTGNLDLVLAPVNDGDILQWNGSLSAFTMSNTIDGGQY